MLTVTAVVSNRCNFNCLNCIAGGPKSGGPEIRFREMLDWLWKYAPGCDLHISGGEPLLIDGLYRKLQMCVDAGHDVTVFTNGALIRKHIELTHLPVKWHVTHHADQINLDAFLFSIKPLRTKQHVICRLREGHDALNVPKVVESMYAGYNFKWIVPFGGYHGYRANHDGSPMCENIMMIGTDGTVFPCSTTRGVTLGNIYDMTFDESTARDFKCLCSRHPDYCQALQSAEIIRGL